ncbi:MAG: DEAD/DEAH box helicase, partial [Flavobacterium sp.]
MFGDMMGMMGKLRETQQKIEETKKRLDTVLIDEASSDGLLKITITANREIKILYISPERLALPGFRELLKDTPISLIAVDEAHCVQQWGQGFRPEYGRLGTYLGELPPCPKMALTATLTPREREEVIKSLGMNNPEFISLG